MSENIESTDQMVEEENTEEEEVDIMSFGEMGIDDRILMAVLQLGWDEPTPIQVKTIKLTTNFS